MKQRKILWSLMSVLSAGAWMACTAPEPGTDGTSSTDSTGATTNSTTTASTAGTTDIIDVTTGASTATTTDATTAGTTAEPDPECEVDPVTGMEVCNCTQLASWGALGTYGAVPGADGQDAIVAWLNDKSTGDALYFEAKPVINAVELAKFDVILMQDLSGWAPFTPDEKAAFQEWVNAGGGVISLNGYSADDNEMANVNDLLAFSTLAYEPGSDTANETQRKTKLGICEDCYGASVPQDGWTTHPIGLNMKQVGAFHGRAVRGGTPVAEEFGAVLGASADVGLGHVFLFHDEWVTYNSQWTGEGLVTDCTDPQYSANGQCTTEHPSLQYSIPQFWYNSIQWASGNPECFVIDDDTILR